MSLREQVSHRMNIGLDRYGRFTAAHPFTVFAIGIVLMAVLGAGGSQVEVVDQSTSDLLPDSIPSIAAFDTIEKEFNTGTGSGYTVIFLTAPDSADSDEVRDLRDPRFIRYVSVLAQDIDAMNDVSRVTGPQDLYSELPVSLAQSRTMLTAVPESRTSQFISADYSAARLSISPTSLSATAEERLADDIQAAIDTYDAPAGVEVRITGEVFINQAFQNESGDTMQTTTMVSLIGVFVLLLVLFRSLFDSIISLTALIFGIVVGYGVFGWLGLDMSPTTSGAISMGLGIAIDYGIQTVSRYREERTAHSIADALSRMMQGVFNPMFVALIASLIGFSALRAGRITFLSDLGTLLSLTTACAFVGAYLLIPSGLVIYDRYLATRTGRIVSMLPQVKSL